jgi:hypothetical protein
MTAQDPHRDELTVMQTPINLGLLRQMCVVFAPWPDSTGLSAEQGLFCSTCLYTEKQAMLYMKETSLEHLKHCRVQTLEDDFCQSWMPVDNSHSRYPEKVYRPSLV